MKLSRTSALLAILAVSAVTLFGLLRSRVDPPKDRPLTAYAPPGALLVLESPDFHTLLNAWTSSPEEQRWLTSDDYAGFSRSRLFGRLKQAQDEFATSAGLPPDSRFLTSIAGRESLFAWYDIGNLQFLYITQMSPDDAQHLPLLALRDRYEKRSTGGTPFYIRSEGDAARTVAFAIHGNLLLLATREDLLAGALQLLAHPAPATLQHEPWFAAAQAAAPAVSGDLRMTLNMSSVVRSPYFRTYWVQRNITDLKAYSAEVSDLFRSPGEFREERVLLPSAAASGALSTPSTDLAPVLSFVPSGAIYHATAQPDVDAVLAQLDDKLLARTPASFVDSNISPTADLSIPTSGSATDLEQRIDQPPTTEPSRFAALGRLRAELSAAAPVSMLVFSRIGAMDDASAQSVRIGDANTPPDAIFLPVHTAVVLQASHDWNQAEMEAALTTALAPKLSVASLGLTWSAAHEGVYHWRHLEGFQHLAFRIDGRLCVFASDDRTLRAALQAASTASRQPLLAQERSGADLATARQPLSTLAKRLDHTAAQPSGAAGEPPFFSGDLVSIGKTFADVASETFTQTRSETNANIHQGVVYQWH